MEATISADYRAATIAADCKYANIEPLATLPMLACNPRQSSVAPALPTTSFFWRRTEERTCHAAASEPAAGPAEVNPKNHTTGERRMARAAATVSIGESYIWRISG
jgi:hypothetical protein